MINSFPLSKRFWLRLRFVYGLRLKLSLYIAAQIVLLSQQVFLNKIYFSSLTESDYGALSLWFSTITLSSVLVSGPLSAAAVKFLATEQSAEDKTEIYNALLFILLNGIRRIIAPLYLTLFLGLALTNAPSSSSSILIIPCLLIASFANSLFLLNISVFNCLGFQRSVFWSASFDTLVKLLFVYLATAFPGSDIVTFCFAFSFSSVISSSLSFLFASHHLTYCSSLLSGIFYPSFSPSLYSSNPHYRLISLYISPFRKWGIPSYLQQSSEQFSIFLTHGLDSSAQYAVILKLLYTPMTHGFGLLLGFMDPYIHRRLSSSSRQSSDRNSEASYILLILLALLIASSFFLVLIGKWYISYLSSPLLYNSILHALFLLPIWVASFASFQLAKSIYIARYHSKSILSFQVCFSLVAIPINVISSYFFSIEGLIAVNSLANLLGILFVLRSKSNSLAP